MILHVLGEERVDIGKPRASGDDPTYGAKRMVIRK